MPRGSVYRTNESDLCDNDQTLLRRYREWQEVLSEQAISPFNASSVKEHKQNIKHKGISKSAQDEFIAELLRYHGWAVMDRECSQAHDVHLIELIICYDDLYSYCKWLENTRNVKLWTMNKICQAVIGMCKFMESNDIHSNKSELDEMINDIRRLYASISRSANTDMNNRPSLCERRERGEALSFLDIVKVHEAQYWRVNALSKFWTQPNLTLEKKKSVHGLFVVEVEKLSVIQTLLRYPTRNVELKRTEIKQVGETWRLKLSASGRKTGKYPIDVRLSRKECEMFNFLRKAKDLDLSSDVTDLRSAAESHIDIIGYKEQNDSIQKALSYAEGHCESIAKMFYKRNGSATIMQPWTTYINKLMNIEQDEPESDAVDKKILNSIAKSQERWVKGVQSILARQSKAQSDKNLQKSTVKQSNAPPSSAMAKGSVLPGTNKRKRLEWTKEEDDELRKRAKIHGNGNWKDILDNSDILKNRYSGVTVLKAREGIRERWRRGLFKPSDDQSASRNASTSTSNSYPRHRWSAIEDSALELGVDMYGNNWKDILKNSTVLQEKYCHLPATDAQRYLKERWSRKLSTSMGVERNNNKKRTYASPIHQRRKKKGRISSLNTKSISCDFHFSDNKVSGKEKSNAVTSKSTPPPIIDTHSSSDDESPAVLFTTDDEQDNAKKNNPNHHLMKRWTAYGKKRLMKSQAKKKKKKKKPSIIDLQSSEDESSISLNAGMVTPDKGCFISTGKHNDKDDGVISKKLTVRDLRRQKARDRGESTIRVSGYKRKNFEKRKKRKVILDESEASSEDDGDNMCMLKSPPEQTRAKVLIEFSI